MNDLASPGWWLSVFTVGVVINLLSAYLKPRCDGLLSRVSRSWATRTERQRQERAERIRKLRNNSNERMFAGFAELRHRIGAVLMLNASLICMSAAVFSTLAVSNAFVAYLAAGASVIASMSALYSFFYALRLADEFNQSRDWKEPNDDLKNGA